jgi:hypothetical protein
MPNISQMMPSKYLKKEDVPQPAMVTIRRFTQENVAPSGQPEEKKWIMHFDELENGMVMNPTNLQLAALAVGSEETDDWIGHQVVIYNDPNVSFAGKLTGGIRIRAVRRKAPPPPKPALEEMDDDIPF